MKYKMPTSVARTRMEEGRKSLTTEKVRHHAKVVSCSSLPSRSTKLRTLHFQKHSCAAVRPFLLFQSGSRCTRWEQRA